MDFILNQETLDAIDETMQKDLVEIGVHCALLIDLAGNIISNVDDGHAPPDLHSLAALAAGNFGAVTEMAKLVGEQDFSLLFHKGNRESLHFSRVLDDFLLIIIFNKNVSLGFVRLKVSEAIRKLESLLQTH